MSTLYELTGNYITLMDMLDDPEVDPITLMDTLDAVEGELDEKAENYGRIIRNLEAEAKALKEEADRLSRRKRTIDNNIDSLKKRLQLSMELTGKDSIDTPLFKFRIQKNAPSVVVDLDDLQDMPMEYLTYHEPPVNKTALKDALKAGLDLTGIAHLEQSQSLRIR